jgi:hypothetical protein
MGISPEIERVYQQLLWIDRRRDRILSSVSAHFGSSLVEKIVAPLKESPLLGCPDYSSLVDERGPRDYLAALAEDVESLEAGTITLLRKHVSVYPEHVDEQILFGARTAGQEAGRSFLATAKPALSGGGAQLGVPEAVQAIFELTYNGLPWEKNHFLCLRALGGSTVHFARSPHLKVWKKAGADPKFLYLVKSNWISGMLDILSPLTVFSSHQAIEQGAEFGLAHFYLRDQHAGP